jgi:ribokinase
MKYDIITVGGAVIDVFLKSDFKEKNNEICLPIGEKILIRGLFLSTGGGGTNTAAGFKKMGLKTAFLGALGKDENGEIILKEMKKRGIASLGSREKHMTGYSIVLDSKKNDRTILTYKGANEDLGMNDFSLSKLNTRWFYFASSVGQTLETQKKLVDFANKNNIKIAFNPSSYLTAKGPSQISKILKSTEILVLNEQEAKDLVKTNIFENLHSLGPRIICVTYGEKGARVFDGSKLFYEPARKVKFVERTGAGDAFSSGFISSYIKTMNIEKSLKIGIINSASVISKRGAKNGLLSFSQAIKKL